MNKVILNWKLGRGDLVKIGMLFVVYFTTAFFGLRMDAASGFATLVWPPSGIALAALLLYGNHLWPGVALGAALVNFAVGAPFLVACGIATGNTLEALAGAYLLKRFADFHNSIDRTKDVVALIFLAAGVSTLISASVGIASLWLGNAKSMQGIGATWRVWWIGDVLSDLIVAPLILVWSTLKFKVNFDGSRVIEAALLATSVSVVGYFIFSSAGYLTFWIFPLSIWGALRFGQVGSVTLTFAICVMAILGTAHGLGPFMGGSLRDSLFLLHSFMSVTSLTGLLYAASLEERRAALRIKTEEVVSRILVEEKLRAAVEARDEFLSIASHELKTPLSSLNLQLQITKRGLKPELKTVPSVVVEKSLTASLRQVKSLTNLVEDLLDVSKIESGKFLLNLQEMDLVALIREIAERFTEPLKLVKCSLQLDLDKKIIGIWDHHRIEQILVNLISNIIKYAPGGRVKIAAHQCSQGATIIVQDSGPGVPLEKRLKIFDRFERATSSRNISGLGLGLFVVKQIAQAHGGNAHLEGAPGKGSKFIIELPNQPTKREPLQEPAQELIREQD